MRLGEQSLGDLGDMESWETFARRHLLKRTNLPKSKLFRPSSKRRRIGRQIQPCLYLQSRPFKIYTLTAICSIHQYLESLSRDIPKASTTHSLYAATICRPLHLRHVPGFKTCQPPTRNLRKAPTPRHRCRCALESWPAPQKIPAWGGRLGLERGRELAGGPLSRP